MEAWTNFARTGNPSMRDVEWPKYDLNARSTMIFDRETKIVDDPCSDFRTLVSAI
ncbi:Para-nitrobenzyl esterase [compost metagenome]